MTSQASTLTRSQRLDRLSFNRAHGKLLVGSGVGWALDAMDVGLISFVMAALGQQWALSNTTLSWIGSIGFIGMAVGASLGGLLADRIGRRNVFAVSLLVYGLATGASALVGSVALLIVLRFIVGVGLGAELPVASTYVSEFAPAKIRGRVVVALEAFWAVGWLLSALIGYFVIPAHEHGWRWALAVGVIPTLYALVVRHGLPESVRFLELKGRFDEAERSVRWFEAPAGIPEPSPQQIADMNAAASSTSSEATESLWSPTYRARSLALATVWFMINFSYYGAFIWLPSLLVQDGNTLTKSFEYVLIITLAQFPGYAAAGWLIEVWGRRTTLATFLVGSALAAAWFGLAGHSPGMIIAAGCALSFFNLGAWGALYATGPEIYPTSIRGKGTGAAASVGRIASMLAPLVVPLLLGAGGRVLVFVVLGMSFVVGAVAALFLPERASVALDAPGPGRLDD